jgi:hypothetical protein
MSYIVSRRLDLLDIPCCRRTMNGLLTGVGMCWRDDGEWGMQWSVVNRALNKDLSLPHP